MGNRAVVNFNHGVSAYLHWNGGPESIEAFVDACRELGMRGDDYGAARFCQVVGNFFGGGLSLGIGTYGRMCDMAEYDNGAYDVNERWEITSRENTFNWRSDPELVAKYESIKSQIHETQRQFERNYA